MILSGVDQRKARSALALLSILLTSCASFSVPDWAAVPPGTPEPDLYLFERGTTLLNEEEWVGARTVFGRLVDAYPQSPYRFDAKLAMGDTLLAQGDIGSLIQAVNEYDEFLRFYPTHPRAAYAQFHIGVAHCEAMLSPARDQTSTRAAISALNAFFDLYPDSELNDEARVRHREARDRLSDSDFLVGEFYFERRWYVGAIQRLQTLLSEDPEYSHRDAAYFLLAESLTILERTAEALPYFARLVNEFDQSEYLDRARQRLAELREQAL